MRGLDRGTCSTLVKVHSQSGYQEDGVLTVWKSFAILPTALCWWHIEGDARGYLMDYVAEHLWEGAPCSGHEILPLRLRIVSSWLRIARMDCHHSSMLRDGYRGRTAVMRWRLVAWELRTRELITVACVDLVPRPQLQTFMHQGSERYKQSSYSSIFCIAE